MPWIIAAIWTAFKAMIPTLAGQVLIALGVAVVTTTGLNVGLSVYKDQMLSSLHGLPLATLQLLGLMKVGVCISMLFGALTARMARKGLQAAAGGTMKSFVKK